MSWIAEAHRQWHQVNGPVGTVVCPLDCWEPPHEYDDEEQPAQAG